MEGGEVSISERVYVFIFIYRSRNTGIGEGMASMLGLGFRV